jgi:ABC-type methionine transport system ATPase subunit
MVAKRLQRNLELLKLLKKCRTKSQRNMILKHADKDFIKCLCDCAINILQGNIKMSRQCQSNLKRHRECIRNFVAKKTGGLDKKREFLVQKGGFLPALLAPIIGLAGGLIGDLVAKL